MRQAAKWKFWELIVLLCGFCMLSGLYGCGAKTEPGDAEATAGQGVDAAETGADMTFTADDSLITELYGEEGSYTDDVDNTYTYSYHVPQIDADTAGVQAVNKQIRAAFGTLVESELALMEQKASLTYVRVGSGRAAVSI